MRKAKNNLEDARKLLQSLTDDEHRVLEKYLKGLSDGRGGNKSLRLYQILMNKRNYSDLTIQSKVSPSSDVNSFRNLITYFKDRVYSSLTLDTNIVREGAYSNLYQHTVKSRERISQAEILYSKNLLGESVYLLDRVVRIGTKYELFEETICALNRLSDYSVVREGIEASIQYQNQIPEFELQLKSLLEARRSYFHLCVHCEFNPSDKEFISNYKNKLTELSKASVTSLNAKYYYLMTLQHFQVKTRSFTEAEVTLAELAQLIKSSPALMMPRRMGLVYMFLAHAKGMVGKYQDAVSSFKLAIKYSSQSRFNELQSYDHMAMSYLNLGDLGKSKSSIVKALKLSGPDSGDHYMGKRHYIKAAIHFAEGNYYQAHLSLQKPTKSLDRDATGWRTGVMVLTIINQIQWGGIHRPLEEQIDTLLKRVRSSKKLSYSNRFIVIVEILEALKNTSFDFKLVSSEMKEEIELLSNGKGEMSWEPYSPELIRFDKWFESVLQDQPYQLTA